MIRAMKAAILAVGTELLGTERLDTNSLRLTAVFEQFGVELVLKAVVGDDLVALAAEVEKRLDEVELLVLCGGLGPTADDITRPAVAQALGREIHIDEGVVEGLRQRFASFGRKMAESNRQQAEVIAGATLLANEQGTAPGLCLTQGKTTIFLFPGVPRELMAMVSRHLEPWLEQQAVAGRTGQGIARAVVKVACVPESEVEDRLLPIYQRFGREDITVLASPGEVRVHLRAVGENRDTQLATLHQTVVAALGSAVFSERAELTLEAVVGELLLRKGKTLVTAESCTGGLLAERLTRVPGSSSYFLGGAVVYSNALKTALIGVPAELIAAHGAVSAAVGAALAQGARTRFGSDYALGITGVAGPSGGSADKPVGTVHLALAGPGDHDLEQRQVRFPGDREGIRQQTAQLALDLLRRDLLRQDLQP